MWKEWVSASQAGCTFEQESAAPIYVQTYHPFLTQTNFEGWQKRRNIFVKVSHGMFHDILPKEYSGTFPDLLWVKTIWYNKKMSTNNKGQSDIVIHKT